MGLGSGFLRRFMRHRLAVAGIVYLVLVTLACVLAPQLSRFPPDAMDLSTGGIPQPPSREHWFGTDELGRDYFSRVLHGGRISLLVGFVASAIAVGIGSLVGLCSGFFAGVTDQVLMRLVDVLVSIPALVLIIAANAIFKPSITNVIIIIGVFSWMEVARLVRAQVLSLKEQDFVVSAHAAGASRLRILFRQLLPNCVPTVLVAASVSLGQAVMAESALSFLGMGVQPPDVSWGSLLRQAQGHMHNAVWLAVVPGVLIALTIMSLNLVGDGVRDAQDPRLRA